MTGVEWMVSKMNKKDKVRWIFGILTILSGLLIIAIPTILFPVCKSSGVRMACYYSKQAEIGLGAAVVFIGLVIVFLKQAEIRIGLSIGLLPLAVLAYIYPVYLIGVCHASSMACRIGTLPALKIIASILFVLTVIHLWFLRKVVAAQKS